MTRLSLRASQADSAGLKIEAELSPFLELIGPFDQRIFRVGLSISLQEVSVWSSSGLLYAGNDP